MLILTDGEINDM